MSDAQITRYYLEQKADVYKLSPINVVERITSGITGVENIGDGDGEIFKQIDSNTIQLRTIGNTGSVTAEISGDKILNRVIKVDGGTFT